MKSESQLVSSQEIPHYPVSLWEGMLIVLGAIALTGVGLAGLGVKVLSNAFDPMRAEAIARSLIEYKIPGGSQGVFGINIGSAKLAWVRSPTTPPDVILFVGKVPVDQDGDNERDLNQDFETPPTDDARQSFETTSSSTENRFLCGKSTPVLIAQGQQTFADAAVSLPAVRYTASTVENGNEQLVILTTNGKNAKATAEKVFQSLRCK